MQSTADLMISLLGMDKAVLLFQQYGGSHVYIPKHLEMGEQAQKFKTLLGDESAQLLMTTYGGEKIYMPKAVHLSVCERNKKIQQAFDEALKKFKYRSQAVQSVAKQFNITERWVYAVLDYKEPIKDEKQLTFDI